MMEQTQYDDAVSAFNSKLLHKKLTLMRMGTIDGPNNKNKKNQAKKDPDRRNTTNVLTRSLSSKPIVEENDPITSGNFGQNPILPNMANKI